MNAFASQFILPEVCPGPSFGDDPDYGYLNIFWSGSIGIYPEMCQKLFFWYVLGAVRVRGAFGHPGTVMCLSWIVQSFRNYIRVACGFF